MVNHPAMGVQYPHLWKHVNQLTGHITIRCGRLGLWTVHKSGASGCPSRAVGRWVHLQNVAIKQNTLSALRLSPWPPYCCTKAGNVRHDNTCMQMIANS